MSEGDTGGAVGVSRSPVIPPRPHPPNHRHETSSGSSVNLSPQAKAKKPPMPPPRVKSNTAPRQEVPPHSPRLSPSHDMVVRAGGGGGGKAAAKLNDTEMKIQTLILSDPEFQGCSPDVCLKLLRRHGFDMSSAKEDMRVHMLMEMKIEHIMAEDCRRALSHCQQKLDRAAEWLLEQSFDIERRRQ